MGVSSIVRHLIFFHTRSFTKTVSCLSGCGESEPRVLMLSRQALYFPKHEVLPSSNTEQLTVVSAVSKRKTGEEKASEKANWCLPHKTHHQSSWRQNVFSIPALHPQNLKACQPSMKSAAV